MSSREEWGNGPWIRELDRVEFDHAGLRCVLLRHPRMGHWCGYVGVRPGHPLHGCGYSSHVDALREWWERRKQEPIGDDPSFALMLRALGGDSQTASPDVVFTVHGGLTYASAGSNHIGRGDADEWFFGFDCAHSGDFHPSDNAYRGRGYPWPDEKYNHATAKDDDAEGVYRTVEYARAEAERLAEQIAAVGEGMSAGAVDPVAAK